MSNIVVQLINQYEKYEFKTDGHQANIKYN